MSFAFRCPLCHAQRMAAERIAGRRVRCPECSQLVEVAESGTWDEGDMRQETQYDTQQVTTQTDPPPHDNLEQPAADDQPAEDTVAELSAEPVTADPDVMPPTSPPQQADSEAKNRATLSGFTPVSAEGVPPVVADTAPSDDGDFDDAWWDEGTPDEPGDDDLVAFGDANEREETEMDMTPMVDVTFLLLIFFMVTASFSLQKSLEAPKQENDDPSTNVQTVEDFEDNMEFVVVRIDEYDTYRVIFAGWEQDEEAPSQHELIRLLRRAREGEKKPSRLVLAAHGDAQYNTVMKAWDAGTDVGMEQIQPLLSEEDIY